MNIKKKSSIELAFQISFRNHEVTIILSFFTTNFSKFLNSEYHLKQKNSLSVFVYLSFFMTCEIYDIEVLKVYLFKFGKVSA